jgi:hypothetical protein
MTGRIVSTKLRLSVARELWGAAPILKDEDAAEYREHLSRVVENVEPADWFEETWANEIAAYGWDVVRYRRAKANFVNASLNEGLERLLRPVMLGGGGGKFVSFADRNPKASTDVTDLVNRWKARDPEAIETVDALLKLAGLTMDTVTAMTLAAKILQIEAFDRMIMLAGRRRDEALRELQRHRALLADKLRRATADIEADYEVVPANANQTKGAK